MKYVPLPDKGKSLHRKVSREWMDYAYFCTSLKRKSKDKLEKALRKGMQQHPGTIKHPQLFKKNRGRV